MNIRSLRGEDNLVRLASLAAGTVGKIRRRSSRAPFLAVALFILPLLPGCSTPTRLEAVPQIE
ncbi:MAG TPA: hypothetical protein VEU06_10425, partial [Micropepsaceae bacterium]|nr:hypothetical protein [Micropepsaceae bacterium]